MPEKRRFNYMAGITRDDTWALDGDMSRSLSEDPIVAKTIIEKMRRVTPDVFDGGTWIDLGSGTGGLARQMPRFCADLGIPMFSKVVLIDKEPPDKRVALPGTTVLTVTQDIFGIDAFQPPSTASLITAVNLWELFSIKHLYHEARTEQFLRKCAASLRIGGGLNVFTSHGTVIPECAGQFGLVPMNENKTIFAKL